MKFKKQIIVAVTCAVVILGLFLTVSYIGGNKKTANMDNEKQQVTTDKQKETDTSKPKEEKKPEEKKTSDDEQQSKKDEVKTGSYIVQKDDTLFSIARAYMPNHDFKEVIATIKEKNEIKNDSIAQGQKLIIPYEVALESKATSTTADQSKEEVKDTAQNTKTGKKYQIQPGDSLYKIAKEQLPAVAHLDAIEKIKAHNGITDINAIKAGDVIYIPEK